MRAAKIVTVVVLYGTLSVNGARASSVPHWLGIGAGFTYGYSDIEDFVDESYSYGLNAWYGAKRRLWAVAFSTTSFLNDPIGLHTALQDPVRETLNFQSFGDVTQFALGAQLRQFHDGRVLGMVPFAQIGAAVYYERSEIIAELLVAGPSPRTNDVRRLTIENDYFRTGATVALGLSFSVSEDSAIDIYPMFHTAAGQGEAVHFWSLMFEARFDMTSSIDE